MKIVTLLENTTGRWDMRHEHGLSLYMETAKHKLLFDMGPNAMFLQNAEVLGVDIKAVDTAFLSHGHNDHSGGLELFCKRNDHAKVYLQKEAFGAYYVVTPDKCAYIGMDLALHRYEADRFIYVDGQKKLDDELTVFSGAHTHDLRSSANDTLRRKEGDAYPQDDFAHELSLIVSDGGKTALFAGCAHNGIVNLLRDAEQILGKAPDAVFAGFHLYNPTLRESEPEELVRAVGEELASRKNTQYYTGHCTGDTAYDILEEMLGSRLHHMSGGSVWNV